MEQNYLRLLDAVAQNRCPAHSRLLQKAAEAKQGVRI